MYGSDSYSWSACEKSIFPRAMSREQEYTLTRFCPPDGERGSSLSTGSPFPAMPSKSRPSMGLLGARSCSSLVNHTRMLRWRAVCNLTCSPSTCYGRPLVAPLTGGPHSSASVGDRRVIRYYGSRSCYLARPGPGSMTFSSRIFIVRNGQVSSSDVRKGAQHRYLDYQSDVDEAVMAIIESSRTTMRGSSPWRVTVQLGNSNMAENIRARVFPQNRAFFFQEYHCENHAQNPPISNIIRSFIIWST